MLRRFILNAGFMFIIQIMNMSNVLADTPKEYEIKAVFLFNFTNFIRWPETVLVPNTTIKLCVLGDDPFGKSLDDAVANNEKSGKYQVVVQRLKFPKDDISGCHILFVSRSEQDNYLRILSLIAQKPVLTIGETDDFLAQGGMIEFFIQENRVRLAIALPNLRAAQLNANANLLKVAKLRE